MSKCKIFKKKKNLPVHRSFHDTKSKNGALTNKIRQTTECITNLLYYDCIRSSLDSIKPSTPRIQEKAKRGGTFLRCWWKGKNKIKLRFETLEKML